MKKEIIEKLLKLNKDFYEENADYWNTTRNKQNFNSISFLKKLKLGENKTFQNNANFYFIISPNTTRLEKLINKKDLKILDIGCGNGRITKYFDMILTNKYDYLGLDNSKNLIKIAKYQFPKYSFKVFDIVYDNWKEIARLGKFDLICCFAVLHHIPSKKLRKKIINNMKYILNKDGTLVIYTWDFLMYRKNLIIDPKIIGIIKEDLEENDYILTWENNKYRYLNYLDKI